MTEAESVPVSANAGAELAKMFRTCGEPGASSVTERVSLRGPEKMGRKSYARGAIGIGGDGGDGAAGGVDERVLELGSGGGEEQCREGEGDRSRVGMARGGGW